MAGCFIVVQPCVPLTYRAQSSILKLNELRSANVELNRQVDDTKKEKDELAGAKDRLQREMEKLRDELRAVKDDLSSAESERVGAMEEVKAMQQLMFENKEHDVCFHCKTKVTVAVFSQVGCGGPVKVSMVCPVTCRCIPNPTISC